MAETPDEVAAYDEGYNAGKTDGVILGRAEARQEFYEPVEALIAVVKEAQTRKPEFIPLYTWHGGGHFYDSLIRFLEEGELPLEWRA